MKKLIIIIMVIVLVSVISIFANAQKIVEKQIGFANKESIAFKFQFADSIKIQTWNQNNIAIKVSVNINQNQDNDRFTLDIDESSSIITIKSKIEDMKKLAKKNKYGDCCSFETDIYFEVFIPQNVKFSIETISGNIILAGVFGEIKAKTISGFIDLTFPSNFNADLSTHTISGTIYSNHEFKAINRKHRASSEVVATLNSGGKNVTLNTISGDIYLREK
jgi:hypothetical protein